MTPTTRKTANLVTILLLACLFTFLATHTNAQSDDRAGVRRVVSQFFDAFQQKDLPGVMALWSENSPDLTADRQIMQQTFASYRTIEVKNALVNRITIDTDKASVQLTFELNAVGTQPDASATRSQLIRTIQLIKESSGWKVWKYLTREDQFAETLSAVATQEEMTTLLNAQPELVTLDLVRALTKQARDLMARGKQAQASTICDLALNIAQRLN